MLETRLFGQPQISSDGAPFAFRAPARAFSVLAYLLLHAGQPQARDTLAFTIWPDLPEPEARTKLRTHLHYLVSGGLPVSGSRWLIADKRTVQFNPEQPVWVDVREFERLSKDPNGAAGAIELYAGDLLAGFEDQWVQAPRSRLRERVLALMLDLVERSREDGDSKRAMEFAQRMLAIDPWREDAIRALVRLRQETGDRAGALQLYRDFAQRLSDELGVEPLAETTAAYERAASQPGSPERRDNLPQYLTSFINRHSEIDQVRASVMERRLVTLTGTGGVGKSRLAIEAARMLTEHFSDGIWLADLASLADDESIAPAIAVAFGLGMQSELELYGLLEEKRALLLLDNCEHLPAVSRVAERIVRQCPGIRILATSRAPLRIVGEHVQRVPSLHVPSAQGNVLPSLNDLQESAAVRLFLDRVADVSPAFPICRDCEDDRWALAAIAQRLDGIPLAIELAAARASSLPLSTLAGRLEDRFMLLTGGSLSALPRHQTLRATLDWSFDALSEVEQFVFVRTGVFAGGWTLPAADAVCGGGKLDSWQVEETLGALVDKSLVVADNRDGAVRYRLLESMRAYALEKLDALGERDAVTRLHARYFAALGQDDPSFGIRDREWFQMIRPEMENLRAAMSWAIGRRKDLVAGSALASSFGWFAYIDPLLVEGANLCRAELAALPPDVDPALEAPVQLALARCESWLQQFAGGATAANRAVELYERLGDRDQLVIALYYGLNAAGYLGQKDMRSRAEQALSIAEETGNPRSRAYALYAKARAAEDPIEHRNALVQAMEAYRVIGSLHAVASALADLGEALYAAGDARGALDYAEQGIAVLSDRMETQWADLVLLRSNAAAYALALGETAQASAFAKTAVELASRIGDHRIAWAFQHLAAVALEGGDPIRAAKLLGASDKQFQLMSLTRESTEQLGYDRTMESLRTHLTTSEIEDYVNDGFYWSAGRAATEALSVEGP